MARFVRQPDSMKWGELASDPQAQVMTFADMDLPLHEPFRAAILHRLTTANNFTYKNASGESLRAIINWYRRHHLKSQAQDITP
jgi:bifunctional pyridoxal-dependent enzyme with beta-cystathionase and maltose regulon repressor activities